MLGRVADDRDDEDADEELDSPMSSEAASIEPTRISLMSPTSTADAARNMAARRVDQPMAWSSPFSSKGLKTARWVLSEKNSPAR